MRFVRALAVLLLPTCFAWHSVRPSPLFTHRGSRSAIVVVNGGGGGGEPFLIKLDQFLKRADLVGSVV